jgi:hypothetical protein
MHRENSNNSNDWNIPLFPLMNLFKKLVLEQKDKKRMGKWIRQRFLLIAGRLVRSERKFILKLQGD